MSLIVHHLQHSQSERVVWLCEELELPYELKVYSRDRKTFLAPPELKALHPAKTAPVIQDGDLTVSESSAILQYIIHKHGKGRFAVPPTAANYAEYLFWFHWAVGTLQPNVQQTMFIGFAGLTEATHGPLIASLHERRDRVLQMLDDRLKVSTYLAGDELTAADIQAVFSVSTMRLFQPFPLTGYDAILAWLERCTARPAYKRFLEKGETGEPWGVVPTIGAEAPKSMGSYSK